MLPPNIIKHKIITEYPLLPVYSFKINSAISSAISSTVLIAVLRANLSAKDGLNSITSFFVILCHIGSIICSPETAFVIIATFTQKVHVC